MQQKSTSANETYTVRYTTAIDMVCEIAHRYFFSGRLAHALSVLRTSLPLVETGDVSQEDQLKLLLLYGRVLTVDHLIRREDAALLLTTALQAKQLAEASEAQQGLADALSVLGLARSNAATVALLQSGRMPFGTQGQGRYEEALADLQQALTLQESLHDTRGISESHFGIGLIQQFWQQNDQAREHFMQAIEVAEQHGHILEQADFGGDLDQALTYGKRALAFREAAGFKPYQPIDHLTLSDIYRKQGDTVQAQFHREQAFALASEMGFPGLIAEATNVSELPGVQDEK